MRPTGTNSTAKLPVMAWIHGGGFTCTFTFHSSAIRLNGVFRWLAGAVQRRRPSETERLKGALLLLIYASTSVSLINVGYAGNLR
jgi:hypothetical protein